MTKNNNSSMKTVVETFIVEETQELIYDNEQLDKWNDLVTSLNLAGQTTIVKEKKSPIPFLYLKNQLVEAFNILCPVKIKIEDYSKSAIPVEILELAALSKKEQYFYAIEIWYDDKTPDPVCVGLKLASDYDPNYSSASEGWYKQWKSDRFLIGRWGDVKMSLDKILDKAKKLFVMAETSRIKNDIKEANRKLEDLEKAAEDKFGFALPETKIDGLPF